MGGLDDPHFAGSGPISFPVLAVVDYLCRVEPSAVIVYGILRGGEDSEETVFQVTSLCLRTALSV